jgi:transcriptional regulator with XRE-family HTH domain
MAKYNNKKVTKLIGQNIEKYRLKADLEIEDIAEMTGFHRNTIISIENGANTDMSHFIEVSFALKKHPKEILDIPLDLKPRYPLSEKRKEKNRLTFRVRALISEGFFKTSRSGRAVCDELAKRYPKALHIETKNISVILKRQVTEGKLSSEKTGKRNLYKATGEK